MYLEPRCIINDNYNIHGILWPSSMWDWKVWSSVATKLMTSPTIRTLDLELEITCLN